MRLIYATTNEGKLSGMRKMLSELPVTILGLRDESPMGALDGWPDVDENGTDPLTNAVIKARAYYAACKRPLFSLDSGLYIDGVPEACQPGTHVRQINGKRLTDEEMTVHYAAIARQMGGRVKARYVNGICLILSEDTVHTYTGPDISFESFYITDQPHPRRTPGFPIDCLSIHIGSGQYYYDRPAADELDIASKAGFVRFFRRALGMDPVLSRGNHQTTLTDGNRRKMTGHATPNMI